MKDMYNQPLSFECTGDTICKYCSENQDCRRDDPKSDQCYVAYDEYVESEEW